MEIGRIEAVTLRGLRNKTFLRVALFGEELGASDSPPTANSACRQPVL